MCGILGLIHRDAALREPLTDLVMSRLGHRGPDGSGTYTSEHIQFGHARLSIIDLTEAGHQPMLSQDRRFVVTYNGEIYNHLELRTELEALGETFVSHSDTEVLLVAYKVWGRQCVERFRGMFAFGIWDQQTRKVFLARDRCGEKPLFYYFDQDRLIFASELKALIPLLDHVPELDLSSIDMYLHYQYVPEPYTLLRGVHKLAAGHVMTLSPERWEATPEIYWSVENSNATESKKFQAIGEPSKNLENLDQSQIRGLIRDGVEDAVKMTLRSDVPVGIALSGGVDSGAIAVFAQKNYPEPMHAFCVGYPGRPAYDERNQARALAGSLGMVVHEVELPVESFVDFFPQLVRIMDEPIADPAAFGHYSVPRAAAEQGVKVMLSGIGGDELFWGYPYVTQAVEMNQRVLEYPMLKSIASWLGSASAQKFLFKVFHYQAAHPEIRRWAGILQKLGDKHNPEDQLMYYMLHPEFDGPFNLKEKVYGPAMQGLDRFNPFKPTAIGLRTSANIPSAIIRLLFETWLTSNCLSLGDRVSMAVGVETRMPFLDVRLIELVMSLRESHPDHALGQKAWLRNALKGVVPDEVLARPKAGFQPPIHEWLSGVVSRYGHVLHHGKLVSAGVLDRDKIEYLCNELHTHGWTELFFTYKLVLLEYWYQEVVAQ